MKINIPTKITISRIVLIVLMIIALLVCDILYRVSGWTAPNIGNSGINLVYFIVFFVFIIASLTDTLDGYLARKWHQVTTLGKFLDPIADKMLVNSMLVFLCVNWGFAPGQMQIPAFVVIVMIVRDLIVDALRSIAADKGQVIAANIFGKLKTIFQMFAIPFVLINGWPFIYFDANWGLARIGYILVYLAMAMSIISGVIYVVQNRHVLSDKGEKK